MSKSNSSLPLSIVHVGISIICKHIKTLVAYTTTTTTVLWPPQLCPRLPGFTGAKDSEWKWHQLGHMQICTSPETGNQATQFSTGQMPFQPLNQEC